MNLIQKSLSEICTVKTGKRDANHGNNGGDYTFFTCADKPILSPTFSFSGEAIILPGNGANVGLVLFYDGKFEAYQRTYTLQDFKCDSRFLFYHLKGYWRNFNANKKFGSATNYIRMQNFDDYKIPLPPLEEQKRIAAILDKADRIRRKLQEAIRLTEELGRSIFLDMFGDPVTNSKGLETKSLGNIATFLGGGTPARNKDEYFQGDICWASSKDMGDEILLDTQEHITQQAIDNSSTKLLPPGTLLIVVKSKILMVSLPVGNEELTFEASFSG